jgi:glycosyl-4,4'-diaponeurosporenoate acyltransferase
MMLIELSIPALVIVNILAWLAIHLGVAYAFTQAAESRFSPRHWLFRLRRWEDRGQIYSRLLAIHKWKRHLPDGASLFKRGFRKKRLLSKEPAYLRRFRLETCRAEAAHWLMMAFGPLFFIWNPPAAALFNVAYAVLLNLPIIMVQRYNRYRFNMILEPES